MTVKLKNNVYGFLLNAISGADTAITLTAGGGAAFPALGSGEYFYATISNTAGGFEVVKCTSRSIDALTVVRAQEGTGAQSFSANSRIEMRITAQSILDAITDIAGGTTAVSVSIADAGNYYSSTNVEGALQEAALASTTRWIPPWTGARTNLRVDDGLEQSVVNALAFTGVDATGASDSTVGLQAALNSGAKVIRVPAGTYKIAAATLTVPYGVSLVGDGANATIFDGSTAVYGDLTDGYHIATPEPTFLQIQDLAANVSKGSHTITLTSAPALNPGDIICIYNPTDYSFSGYRTYYRAGEYARVLRVSGAVVTLETTLVDSYTAAAVDVYKMTGGSSHFQGFTVKCLTSGGVTYGAAMQGCIDSSMEDVKSVQATYGGLVFTKCFDVAMRDCTAVENGITEFGGDYGLIVSNSHAVRVTGGYFIAARHGITVGGSSGVGAVSNRYISFENAVIASITGIQAADIHGNAEYTAYINCDINGGVTPGGDFFTMIGCHVHGDYSGNGNVAIMVSELRGANFLFANNIIENNAQATGRGAFIDIGGNSDAFTGSANKGGVITITGNTMKWWYAQDATEGTIKVVNRGYIGTEPIGVSITNNTLLRANPALRGENAIVDIQGGAYTLWDFIDFSGNNFQGAGALSSRNSAVGYYGAKRVSVHNNVISGAGQNAIELQDVRDTTTIRGNTITNARYSPVFAVGTSSLKCNTVHVEGNTLTHNQLLRSASSTTASDIIVWYATNVFVRNNFTGTLYQSIGVTDNAGFVIGETVTGATSGATAVILANYTYATALSVGTSISGTFLIGETITGSVSSATTTVTNPMFANSVYANSFLDVTNLWAPELNASANLENKGDYLNTVTNYKRNTIIGGAATYNPASLPDGDGVTTTVTATGVVLGDYVENLTFTQDLQGVTMFAWVSAADTVSVRFQNETGGVVDIASGAIHLRVRKRL